LRPDQPLFLAGATFLMGTRPRPVSGAGYGRRVDGRQLEARCGCGAAWFVFAFEDPDDLEIECLACGGDGRPCA